MLVLIWIQTVWHSDSVPHRILSKSKFWKKSADDNKSMNNYLACKELRIQQRFLRFGRCWSKSSFDANVTSVTLCMVGNISFFCCRLLTLKKIFQEHYQSVKQFRSRCRPTFCRSWNGSKLFAKFISSQQKLPLARKESFGSCSGSNFAFLNYIIFNGYGKPNHNFSSARMAKRSNPDQLVLVYIV